MTDEMLPLSLRDWAWIILILSGCIGVAVALWIKLHG
jgi:hypothetical protein